MEKNQDSYLQIFNTDQKLNYHGTTKIKLIKNMYIKNKFNKVKGSNPKQPF